ncbi:MAG: hypothetical protein JNK48_01675, partial [Bryobacterales bacterium]|nr:hypothetical protein [Bryobacterales bacterium]
SVVVEADAKRKPARLAAGSLSLDGYNINRHTKLDARPSDRDLAVLRIDNLDGKPIALVVNWAAHPTTIPSTTMQFSADYVGALKKRVMQETGAVAVFLQGAAGDQRTNRGGKDYLEYGDALGWEAVRLAGRLQPAAAEKPSLRVREERFQFKPRVDLKNPVVSMLFAQAFFLELTRNFEDEYENGVRPRLTVALLNGEIAMVGASGEFFSSHAIRLKERARVKTLFFFGYCNGYHQYFPTIEAAAEGGYGASPSEGVAEVGAGERMMDAALIWLYQMRGRLR